MLCSCIDHSKDYYRHKTHKMEKPFTIVVRQPAELYKKSMKEHGYFYKYQDVHGHLGEFMDTSYYEIGYELPNLK
jgi:hypothetical protein